MTAPEVTRVQARKLLKKEKQPGLFGGRYRFSPYMACGHGCIYCDGRFEKYHVQGDFDHDIVARVNTPDLLADELPRLREPGPVCISSGVSDPYQPVEEELLLTRRSAEVLAEGDRPVVIHTKSSLLLRDIDIWERLNRRAPVTVMVSLTITDKTVRKWLEPGASTVEQRLKLLSECSSRGIGTGVLAMPFVPFLTDGEEQLSLLLGRIMASGADFAMPGLLTLKEGRQKGFFFSSLRKARPDLVEPLLKLYSDADRWGSPPGEYSAGFHEKVERVWGARGADTMIPHRLYKGQFTLYDEFAILLGDMQTLYRRKGVKVGKLRTASRRFQEWVEARRRHTARRRNLSYSMIDDYLRVMTRSGELGELLKNRKLGDFLREVEAGGVFDYLTLGLEGRGQNDG